MRWHQKPSKEETYSRDPSPYKIEPLSYCLGNLRDPRTFPCCSRPTSSRYSVLAGFPGRVRHFLLLVSNMGQFPELTPVCSQAIESWLSTLDAGDITLLLEWMPTSTRRWSPVGRVVAWWEWTPKEGEVGRQSWWAGKGQMARWEVGVRSRAQ